MDKRECNHVKLFIETQMSDHPDDWEVQPAESCLICKALIQKEQYLEKKAGKDRMSLIFNKADWKRYWKLEGES